MKGMAFLLALALLLLVAGTARAQNADAIIGKWLTKDGKSHVEISKAPDGKYFGKIVWLKEPIYPADDKKGMAGKTKVDRENPDPAKRNQPTLGLLVLRNFVHSGGNLWEQGLIYDPENGKDYRCKATLVNPNTLNVRGFIGISLIGRTEVWIRVKAST